MLCSFLPYKKMNQPDMTYMPSFLDFLPIQFTTLQLSSVSCTIQYILISYQFYTQYRQYIRVNPNLPVPLSLLSPLYPFICSLKLGLFFCFANRIIYTIFLDAYYYIHSLVFWAGKLLALYNTVLQYHLSNCIVIIIIYVPLHTKVYAHVSSHLRETYIHCCQCPYPFLYSIF